MRRGLFATIVFRGSAPMLTEVHSLWNTSVSSVEHVANLTYTLVFQSVPPVSAGNLMGIDPAADPEKTLVLCLLANFWGDLSDSDDVIGTTKDLLASIEQTAQKQNATNKYQYLNYAGSWQHPLESYGPDQLQALRAVSRKYDPKGLFQTGVPGGFKLHISK